MHKITLEIGPISLFLGGKMGSIRLEEKAGISISPFLGSKRAI
jgi:hypothetical protein